MLDAVFPAPLSQTARAVGPNSHWRLDDGLETRPDIRQRLAKGRLIDYDLYEIMAYPIHKENGLRVQPTLT